MVRRGKRYAFVGEIFVRMRVGRRLCLRSGVCSERSGVVLERNQRGKYDKIGKAVLHTVILLYGLSMVFLFYKQTGWTGGAVYESDLPVHIRMIVEDGWYYSLTALVYQLLFLIPVTLPDGAPFGNLAVAVFLALCGWLSVYLTAFLLKDMQKGQIGEGGQKERGGENTGQKAGEMIGVWHLLGGLALNLVMPCYVRGISDGRYIGMEAASIWHNSTYIVMKMTGLWCVLCYGRLAGKYRRGITWKEWGGFTLLLSVCTAVKPSFLLVFAPVMAVFLLADLLRGTAFRSVFVFGSTVFLPLLVVLFQNVILFGADTGNGWEIRPGYALSLHSAYPLPSAVLSIFFPLVLLPFFLKDMTKDRWLSGAWLMAAAGFLEVFLFTETGSRAVDGNFMWGYSFAILMIFAAMLVKWAELGKRMRQKGEGGKDRFRAGIFAAAGLLLGWHLYCGIYFYAHLLRGVSYYMWD